MNHHHTCRLTSKARSGLAAVVGVVIAGMCVGVPAAAANRAPLMAAGPAVKIVVSLPNGAPAAGSSFTVVAKAVDSSGHTDTSFDPTASWSDVTGSLSPSAPSDFVNGVSKTTDATVANAYRHDRITVSGGSLTGTSPAFNVTGQLARFTMAGIGKVANQPFKVKITAEDSLGDVITSYTGSPSWSDSSGSLSPSAPAAFVQGVSTTTAQISQPSHADRLTVTDTSAGVQSESAAFNVIGPLDHFAFAAIPTVAQNQPFTVKMYAEDTLGDVIASYNGSPSWSDSSGSLSPAAPAAFVKGVSTTRDAQIADAYAGDKITVSDPGTGVQSTSAAFDVTASTFTTPGSYEYTVPAGIRSINVTVIGAAGGGDVSCIFSGGAGAAVSATLTVTPGEHLSVGVGGTPSCSANGGTGGGGTGGAGGADGGGGGGGASTLAVGFPDFGQLLVVAGGGGGGSFGYSGADAGSPGQPASGCGPGTSSACGGGAGGSSAGGAGGASDGQSGDSAGTPGGSLTGGAGGTGNAGGGGGGGGYYGGGGGGGSNPPASSGAGGGGSSFVDPSATNVSAPTPTGDAAEVAITITDPSAQ